MDEEKLNSNPVEQNSRQPIRVHLPGFITEEEIGLGEVIKRATATAGIRHCGGCGQPAARLNRWLVFSGRRRQ
jgi:hypothetical protein